MKDGLKNILLLVFIGLNIFGIVIILRHFNIWWAVIALIICAVLWIIEWGRRKENVQILKEQRKQYEQMNRQYQKNQQQYNQQRQVSNYNDKPKSSERYEEFNSKTSVRPSGKQKKTSHSNYKRNK